MARAPSTALWPTVQIWGRAHGWPTEGGLAKRAGIKKRLSPHSLRHAFVTACLDAGVPLRDVQIAARHSDPWMTTRYDRARGDLDRHANYIVVGFIEGSVQEQPAV